jgi:tripartite-type tricarboxylate transporter receptor subunit TctC
MSASAQADYPARPIRFIVPQSAGGLNDTLARLIAKGLSEAVSQSVIVDNRGGAGGGIGSLLAANSPADGYTISMGSFATLILIPALRSDAGYKPFDSLVPITLVVTSPYVLTVNPSSGFDSFNDLLQWAKNHPGKLTYGSSGPGTGTQLVFELLKSTTGINAIHVPYKGGAPAMVALLGREVMSMFDNLPAAIPQIKSGKLRALSVTSSTRTELLPDVPTMIELGYPNMEASSFQGVVAPKGVSQTIIERLSREIVRTLARPEVKSAMGNVGNKVVARGPAEFGAFIKLEQIKWTKVIKDAGVKID